MGLSIVLLHLHVTGSTAEAGWKDGKSIWSRTLIAWHLQCLATSSVMAFYGLQASPGLWPLVDIFQPGLSGYSRL